jgi:large subunit ribosomal protein L46
MPFTRYFYFKKDTPALADWKAKASERDWQPARELGGYNPYREDAWNDELLVGDKLSETTSMVDALVKESIPRVVDEKEKEEESEGKGEGEKVGEKKEEVVVVKPLPRITEADRTNDQTRLDRKLNRTLYLCVKRAKGGWGLPAGAIEGRENLRDVRDLPYLTTLFPLLIRRSTKNSLTTPIQAAERILTQTGGVNMNTWIIGNAPAGHHILAPYYKDEKLERRGVKTFFMRARIMAGQANLKDNLFGLSEFKWLTKQEIEKHVAQKYFSAIRNMLHDR